MIYTGTLCLHECPWNKNVADLLLIGGLIGILKCILKLWLSMNTNEGYARLQKCIHFIQSVLNGLIIVWFLLAAFQIYCENNQRAMERQESVYNFGFWLMKSIFLICGMCLVILYCMRKLYCCYETKPMNSIV